MSKSTQSGRPAGKANQKKKGAQASKKEASPKVPDFFDETDDDQEILELTEAVEEDDVNEGTLGLGGVEDEDDILDLTEPAGEETGEDDEVLDLTEEAAEEEDDEILDLTEETEDAVAEEEDDELVQLTDTVDDDEEEILDLTEKAAETTETPEPAPAPSDQAGKAAAEEEDILDLVAEAANEEDVLDLTAELEPVAGEEDASEVSIVLSEEETGAGFLDMAEAAGDEEEEAEAAAGERPDNDMILEFTDTAEPSDIVGADAGETGREEQVGTNGEFDKSFDHEIESALNFAEAEKISPEEEESRLQRAAKVSVHVHNRREVDKPTDFNFDAMHAWHDSVRRQILESGGDLLSERQLETALARAIKEVYAEKFEKMIEQVLEKTILKEIDRLKKLVTGDE